MPNTLTDALQHIAEAKQQGHTTLDLEHCELHEIPPELTELTGLRQLHLFNNKISDLSPLTNLKQLTRLHLSGNKISDLSLLAKLKQLTTLDLRGNKISDLSPLTKLNQITELYLSDNPISDLSPLTNLKQLTTLDLSDNKISDLSPLANLKQLTTLHLRGNKISDLSPLANLKQLTPLDLSGNPISDLSPLANLKHLTTLHLIDNKISDLTPLAQFNLLNQLTLDENPIESLRPVQCLLAKGLSIDTDSAWYDAEPNTITLAGCPIKDPPHDILQLGTDAIRRFFELTAGGDTQPIHEAKLILVGEPGAGKTTLMEKLFDPHYYPLSDATESTLGVVVREGWSFPLADQPEITFRANIWDFGGQEIQYMTHQFFLTPSALYVLVADNRAQHTRFPYWFKIINLLGQARGFHSPVLVVLNENKHRSITNFDLKLYREQYPDLDIQVQAVDFADHDPTRFNQLCTQLQRSLPKLRHIGDQLPRAWLRIRNILGTLTASSYNHINFAEFQAVCAAQGVTNEQDQLLVSAYLHRLGTILHFQDDPSLRNLIILKPKWVVDAVYSVLKNPDIQARGGQFNRAELEAIWQSNYDHIEQGNLLNLMLKNNFDICYPTPLDSGHFIAPQLLPNVQPEYVWDTEDCLQFRFQYTFMPEGIITRLIVRLHDVIVENQVWQKGVVFQDRDCFAQVIEDKNNPDGLRVIDIQVTGPTHDKKYLLQKVRDEIEAIHTRWFTQVQVEQMVPCNCAVCARTKAPHFYKFRVLQRFREKGRSTIDCESAEQASVQQLLEGVRVDQPITKQPAGPAAPTVQVTVNNDVRPEVTAVIQQADLTTQTTDPTPPPVNPAPAPKGFAGWYGLLGGIAACVAALAGWWLTTNGWIAFGVSVVVLLIAFILDPQRYYKRGASAAFGIAGLNALPIPWATSGWLQAHDYQLIIKIGETGLTWPNVVVTGIFSLIGVCLLWLDPSRTRH